MGALSGADRAVVERWCGTIRERHEEDYSARFDRLGSAYAVALEVLGIRLADFRLTAADMSSADDRRNHSANLTAAQQQLEDLAEYLQNNDDVSLGSEGDEILAGVLGNMPADGPAGLTTVDVTIDNSRND